MKRTKSRGKITVNGEKTDGKRNVNREKTQKATLVGGIPGKHNGRQAWIYLERLRALKHLWVYFFLCVSFKLKLLVVGQALKSLIKDILTWLNKTSPHPSFRLGRRIRGDRNGRGDTENGEEMRKKTKMDNRMIE